MKSNRRQHAPFITDSYPLRFFFFFSHKGDHACCHLHVPSRFFKGYLSRTHKHNIPGTDISPYHNRHGWLTGHQKSMTFLQTCQVHVSEYIYYSCDYHNVAESRHTGHIHSHRIVMGWNSEVQKIPKKCTMMHAHALEESTLKNSLIANSFYTVAQDIQCTRY